ncbi:MAG: hypothetical protein ACI8UD_003830 [Planctomycetota bacterium]|jgi:hypothetical protein
MSHSDTAGAFELATSHDDWTDTIAVRIAKPGYVSRVARWQQPVAGTKVDLGDVPMLRAIKVTGTVVDSAGRPLSGMQLSARSEGFMGRGRTGDDGRFTVQRAGPHHCRRQEAEARAVRPASGGNQRHDCRPQQLVVYVRLLAEQF